MQKKQANKTNKRRYKLKEVVSLLNDESSESSCTTVESLSTNLLNTESLPVPNESVATNIEPGMLEPFLVPVDSFQEISVPFEYVSELFPGVDVSADVNGNVALIVPNSMIITATDNCAAESEQNVSSNERQEGGSEISFPSMGENSHSSQEEVPCPLVGNTNASAATNAVQGEDSQSRKKVKASRKRMSNIPARKKIVRQKLRNSGQQYVRTDGSVAQARSLGPVCSCRKQCMTTLTHDHCQGLFNNFWALSDFNQQNAFLFGIHAVKPGRRYVDSRDSRRQFTFLFYVTDSSGQSVRVCKQAFLSIFGLQNSRGRINNIMTQIVSGSGTPRTDNRGKHSSRPNRTASSIVDDMKNHIDSFPKYDSHYSRKDNIVRKYLGAELSIKKMYDLFVARCKESKRPAGSRDSYRRIFCEHFNLSFSAPKTDTCKICCAMEIRVKSCTDDDEKNNWKLSGQFTNSRQKRLLT